eukprot:jgi/Chlat1/2297/Chrsp17S02798
MGRPLWYDVADRPATSAVVCACCAAWAALQRRGGLGYEDVGMSYIKVVEEGQLWRVLSSAFSHLSLLHLIFNMSSLWTLAPASEASPALGTRKYVLHSCQLLLLASALVLVIYYALIRYAGVERYRHVTAVGYSHVVFGWMAIVAQRAHTHHNSNIDFFGFSAGAVPLSLAPFGSLLLTQLIVPQGWTWLATALALAAAAASLRRTEAVRWLNFPIRLFVRRGGSTGTESVRLLDGVIIRPSSSSGRTPDRV